jgi:hypothetical protein
MLFYSLVFAGTFFVAFPFWVSLYFTALGTRLPNRSAVALGVARELSEQR